MGRVVSRLPVSTYNNQISYGQWSHWKYCRTTDTTLSVCLWVWERQQQTGIWQEGAFIVKTAQILILSRPGACPPLSRVEELPPGGQHRRKGACVTVLEFLVKSSSTAFTPVLKSSPYSLMRQAWQALCLFRAAHMLHEAEVICLRPHNL